MTMIRNESNRIEEVGDKIAEKIGEVRICYRYLCFSDIFFFDKSL